MEVEGYTFNELFKLEENVAEESPFNDGGNIKPWLYPRFKGNALKLELTKGVFSFN